VIEKQVIYCDGACFPNPGFMGVGVVKDESSFVISVCPGPGTNQVAELLALRIAIEVATPGTVIFTDSKYAYKEARAQWRARANREARMAGRW
jgi:ribonuclease HI